MTKKGGWASASPSAIHRRTVESEESARRPRGARLFHVGQTLSANRNVSWSVSSYLLRADILRLRKTIGWRTQRPPATQYVRFTPAGRNAQIAVIGRRLGERVKSDPKRKFYAANRSVALTQGGPCLGPLKRPLKTGEAKIDDRASVHLPCVSELLAAQFLAARPVWPCCSWDMAWRFSSVLWGLSKVGVPG